MSQTTPCHAYSQSEPFLLTRSIFSALGPLEQLAALALVEVGKVRIIENPGGTDKG
jgi:hypothetical protein